MQGGTKKKKNIQKHLPGVLVITDQAVEVPAPFLTSQKTDFQNQVSTVFEVEEAKVKHGVFPPVF